MRRDLTRAQLLERYRQLRGASAPSDAELERMTDDELRSLVSAFDSVADDE